MRNRLDFDPPSNTINNVAVTPENLEKMGVYNLIEDLGYAHHVWRTELEARIPCGASEEEIAHILYNFIQEKRHRFLELRLEKKPAPRDQSPA